jgi:hypothetical protein
VTQWHVPAARSPFRLARAAALAVACATVAVWGCSGRARQASAPAPAPDALLARITPALSNWLALWRYADPEIAPDSLERVSEAPFTLRDIRGYPAFAIGVRGRLLRLGVWAPDSMRVVEPDTAVTFSDAGFLMHVADGSPATAALVDLKINSIATLDTCSGELDGAFWDGDERFGLTGTTVPDSAGARRAFVRYFDLTAGTVTEFQTRGVAEEAWRHYLVARETARAARLHAAAQ